MRRLLLAAVVVALVLVPVAATGSPLSHAQFVARANAICAKANAAGHALPKASTLKALAAVLGRAVPIVRSEIAAVRALAAPAADRPLLERHLGYLEQEIGAVRQVRKAVAAGKSALAVSLFRKATAIDGKAKAAAKELGLTVCAK